MKGSVQWCDQDVNEGQTWDELKKIVDDNLLYEHLADQSAKDLIDSSRNTFIIVRVVEGYYKDGKEVITKVDERQP